MSVRVRFAPSPTGLLHVGALRTVLFDHLFARRHGGQNILRIEDTDRTRYNPESEDEFIRTLEWVGITFDEGPHVGGPHGPYRQSERAAAGIYAPFAQQLLDSGHAYYAFETPSELEEMREIQQINKRPTGYFGGKWRDASPEQVAEARTQVLPAVVRLKIPRGVTIGIDDFIRGRIEVDGDLVDDPVLIKADGMPTYHMAAMVDDHLMGITHVLRGEEWLSSAPKHVHLFKALGWEPPVFVHCPVIVGADGKKLSKRHGATRVLDYGAMGYHKEALKNFIALIGWSPGDEREVLSEAELIESFSLEGLQPSPGRFDLEKLRWLNGHRIRAMAPEDLLDALLEYARDPHTRQYWSTYVDENPLPGKDPFDGPGLLVQLERIVAAAQTDRAYVLAAVKEEQARVQTLADFGEALEFFLVEEPPMDPKAVAKWFSPAHVRELLTYLLAHLQPDEDRTPAAYEALLREYQVQAGLEKLGPVVHPTRVALTGKTYGPGLFELMAILGPVRLRARLTRALGLLPSG